MKFEESILTKLKDSTTFNSINGGALTLCDPITQLCRRIEAFFQPDSDISCRFIVNNNKSLTPKIDPDTNEPIKKKIEYNGELVDATVDMDHFSEFRIFVKDVEKAESLSNVVRHRHTIPEVYEASSDGKVHIRYHYLLVRVFTITAIDPDGEKGGSDPWISDDDTSSGMQEIFGLEPILWGDTNQGCNPRLAPTDTSTDTNIPKGTPDEYEQQQWEQDESAKTWKMRWIKTALKNNKNVTRIHEIVDPFMHSTWRFIECSNRPVVFQEDNLLSCRGYNSILPADLLPLVLSVFNGFQVSTYVNAI